jgi:hypothetical protein
METAIIIAVLKELMGLVPTIIETWKKKDPTLQDVEALKGIVIDARQYFADHGDPHPKGD